MITDYYNKNSNAVMKIIILLLLVVTHTMQLVIQRLYNGNRHFIPHFISENSTEAILYDFNISAEP